MGQILLWIELLAASCLMVAVATVSAARAKDSATRLLITIVGVLVPLGCWLTVTYMAAWLRIIGKVGPVWRPWFLVILSEAFLIGAIVITRRGLRNGRAALWSAWKLGLIFSAICVLSRMTFWNLDLAAKNQLGHLRARAGSIMVATFPPRIPDSQNAARVYEQAFESLGMTTRAKVFKWAIPLGQWLDWSDGDEPETRPSDEQIREILKNKSRGITQLRRAAGMDQCCFVGYWDSTDLHGALLAQASNMRTAAELIAADARIRMIDGDVDGAVADLNALLSMSEHITQEPTMLTALEKRGIEVMEIMLSGPGLSESCLSKLRIGPLLSHGRMVRSALRGEEVMGLSILSALGDPGHHPLPKRYLPEILVPMYRVFMANDEIQAYNRAVRAWQNLASRPYHESRERWKTLPQRLMKGQTGFLTVKMIPAICAYPERAAEGDALHRLARLAKALAIFRIKNGSLPANLNELTPKYIETIPTDPFNGKPLRMVTDGQDSAILYSVGPDLEDDLGTAKTEKTKKGDVVFRLGPGK